MPTPLPPGKKLAMPEIGHLPPEVQAKIREYRDRRLFGLMHDTAVDADLLYHHQGGGTFATVEQLITETPHRNQRGHAA